MVNKSMVNFTDACHNYLLEEKIAKYTMTVLFVMTVVTSAVLNFLILSIIVYKKFVKNITDVLFLMLTIVDLFSPCYNSPISLYQIHYGC